MARARMKVGCRPVYLGARAGVAPEYPTYWNVPADASAAIELLVADGQVEYEPNYARGAGGAFAAQPALQEVAVAPGEKFRRRPSK